MNEPQVIELRRKLNPKLRSTARTGLNKLPGANGT